MIRIRIPGSRSADRDPDPYPHQNDADPKPWFVDSAFKSIKSFGFVLYNDSLIGSGLPRTTTSAEVVSMRVEAVLYMLYPVKTGYTSKQRI